MGKIQDCLTLKIWLQGKGERLKGKNFVLTFFQVFAKSTFCRQFQEIERSRAMPNAAANRY